MSDKKFEIGIYCEVEIDEDNEKWIFVRTNGGCIIASQQIEKEMYVSNYTAGLNIEDGMRVSLDEIDYFNNKIEKYTIQREIAVLMQHMKMHPEKYNN
jgi:hypothetical protein